MDTLHKLREFVLTNYYVANPASLTDSTSFLDSGIIDSTGLLELVKFVEEEFSIQVADQEMIPDNLDSLANLNRFIERKRS